MIYFFLYEVCHQNTHIWESIGASLVKKVCNHLWQQTWTEQMETEVQGLNHLKGSLVGGESDEAATVWRKLS